MRWLTLTLLAWTSLSCAAPAPAPLPDAWDELLKRGHTYCLSCDRKIPLDVG